MTPRCLPVVHPCAGAPAAASGRAAIARRLAMTLAGGALGLAAGVSLGAFDAHSRVAGRGVAGGAPVSHDAASRPVAPSSGPGVDADVWASIAAVIVPAGALPVRDAGESGGGRR